MEPKSEPSQHLGYAVLSLWILGAVLSDEETKLNKVSFSVNSVYVGDRHRRSAVLLENCHRTSTDKAQLTHNT